MTTKKKAAKSSSKAPRKSVSLGDYKAWIKILDARVTALEKKLKSK